MEEKVDKLFPKDSDISNLKEYQNQGDLNFENEELKREREDIKNDPVFVKCVKNIWTNVLNKPLDGKFSKVEYFKIMLRICKVLIPEFEIKEVIKIVTDEWNNDSKGKKYLDFDSFFNAFFELSDIWTPTINAYDYAHFLKTLFYRITFIEIKKKNGEIIKKKPIIMINFKRKEERKKLSLYDDNILGSKNFEKNDKSSSFIKNMKSIKKLSLQLEQFKKQLTKRFSDNYKIQDSFLYDDLDEEEDMMGKNLFENLLNNRNNDSYLHRNIVLMDVDEINPLEYHAEDDIEDKKCYSTGIGGKVRSSSQATSDFSTTSGKTVKRLHEKYAFVL